MGTKGIALLDLDVDKLIVSLNKAFADEWLAYYQYWLGAKVMQGVGKESIITELEKHAVEELSHAQLLATRIIQLGGTPILEPKLWYDNTTCGYDSPVDPYIKTILEQNLKSEQCAITVYTSLMKDTAGGKDPVTHSIILQILSDEVEHEDDLQSFLEDITISCERSTCK